MGVHAAGHCAGPARIPGLSLQTRNARQPAQGQCPKNADTTMQKTGYEKAPPPSPDNPGREAEPHRVELRGLEPLTPCMPCRCATSCATAPYSCCLTPGFQSHPRRSNSNILEQHFRKFQIEHIRLPKRPKPRNPRRMLPWQKRHRRVQGPPQGSPSTGAPARRRHGLRHAGHG